MNVKKYTIAIDTGTTNTRVTLLKEEKRPAAETRTKRPTAETGTKKKVAEAKAGVGVRNTAIDGNNGRLKDAVRSCIEEVMDAAGITFDEVSRVIASGMITSNMGLVEIPHVPAPAGAKELAANARELLLEDVCPLPILFITGVKNHDHAVTMENFESMDMMRGEEVETLAVLRHFEEGRPYLLVLPGSHTKFVSTDSLGRITGCLTTISGELLSVITENTLISDAVGHQFADEETYDREQVLAGYRAAKHAGIGRACFLTRILNTFAEPDKKKLASYLLGAVLQNDIEAVKGSAALAVSPDTTVIVSGKNPFRQALMDLFREENCFLNVREFVPDDSLSLSAEGASLAADLR